MVAVFAATANVTAAVPLPPVPEVIVSQAAVLDADHVHPAAALTVTMPVDAPAPTDAPDADSVGAHTTEYEKRLDTVLVAVPPGPTADTRASYSTPVASGAGSSGRKATRINPPVPGAGFPRLTLAATVLVPAV